MNLFRRRGKVVDLTEYSRRQKDKIDSMKQEIKEAKKEDSSESNGVFGFFSNIGSSNSNSSSVPSSSLDLEGSSEDKKKKLAKRLVDMTSKIEDLSNQMYHLQQRLEVVERKLSINKF